MRTSNGKSKSHLSRRRILATILMINFVVETCVMLLLPMLMPPHVQPWLEALADAILLSFGSLPLLWLLLIRPMHDNTQKALSALESQKLAMDQHSIVATTDPYGRITYANDKFCKISQYSREQLIGQTHRIVNSGLHPRAFWAEVWKTIETGKVWNGEVCNRAKDGSLYWMDSTIVPFKDEAGRITHHTAIRTDITERKIAESAATEAKAAADDANRAKSDFLANMSHEIRTPMTAILGFAENLLDADQSESEKVNCVHTIRRNGESLIDLINDILDLSKVEAGKMTVESRVCEPCRVIAEVASLVRVRADAKVLPFNIEYIGAIPETIYTDAARLRQVLINLIGNAIKFTETGTVRIATRLVDDGDTPCLQFDVIDTGRGMTEDQVAKLFQPFMQADNSTTRNFGGTGLGLTISKRFAELLGGDITVATTELGVGTTFRATISTGPLDGVKMLEDPMSMTIVADAARTVSQVAKFDLHGLRILYAEDGPDNQRLISFILKKAGADVMVEENGKLALDAALAARDEGRLFDVILMDMQMPVMDGYEATVQLRQKGYTAPIIALTAHAMAGDREKCIKAGCDDYATKPVDRKRLIDLILEYVRSGQPTPDSDPIESPKLPPLHACRILLAEDNPTNQVLVVGILKKAGAEITAVKDGMLAFDAALAAQNECKPFDVILMDIEMPLMDGDEVTKRLRDQGYTKPIIALTAHVMNGDRVKYLEIGFDDYATKPINRVKLMETIRQHWVGAAVLPATIV